MLEAIARAKEAIAADPVSLSAHRVLASAHYFCHLFRWGPEPENAIEAAWSAVERMQGIDALDYRTLQQCGVVRVMRGEQERGIGDFASGTRGQSEFSFYPVYSGMDRGHGGVMPRGQRACPAGPSVEPPRHLGRDRPTRARHGELYRARVRGSRTLGRASDPIGSKRADPAPSSIACCARADDLPRAAQERTVLDGFAPDFIPSLFRGQNPVFTRRKTRSICWVACVPRPARGS